MSDAFPGRLARAVFSPDYAVLLRAGVDRSAFSSWDARLPRDPRLLVPIDVQALVVPLGSVGEAVPTATVVPVTSPQDNPGGALPVPPAPFGDPGARPAGVHLHWAVPDGLARGDAGTARGGTVAAGNPLSLPPLPDRWVVVRMVHGQSSVRAWVVLADRGERHPLAGWTEPGPLPAGTGLGASGRRVIARERLNAVAGGDPAWAATYDAVVDRFAFHDDLADMGGGRAIPDLSYLVAGWWSDPALDPLRDCVSVGAYQERARWLGWLAPEPEGLAEGAQEGAAQQVQRQSVGLGSPPRAHTGATASLPGLRALRGMAAGEVTFARADLLDVRAALRLPAGPAMPRLTLLHGSVVGVAPGGGLDLAPEAGAIEVAVGPTGFAALSALLADGSAARRVSSERVLAAFASGLLSGIDGPGGQAAVDEDRHAAGFVAFGAGARARPDRIAEGDLMAGDRPPPAPPATPPAPAAGGPAERAEAPRARLVRREAHRVRELSQARRLEGAPIGAAAAPRSFRDVAVPAPRAFVPADLAVVLRGAARSLRHGGDGRFTSDGRLACRLPAQVVRGYQGLLDGRELPAGLRSLGSGAVPEEVDLLLRETALTDPYRWGEVTAWGSAATGLPAQAVSRRMRAETALRTAAPRSRGMRAELDAEAGDVIRRASITEGHEVSPVGVTRWAQPWIPLWCDWELELRVDDAIGRWTLGPVDLEPRGENGPDGTATRVVQGRSPLAGAAARALAGQIRRWLSDEDARDQAGQSQVSDPREAELAEAAAAAEGLDVLAAALGGVRETLLGLDPDEASQVAIHPDGTPRGGPPARGLPLLLAGGGAALTRLRVVDAFGRWRDVPAQRLASAEVATALAHPAGAPRLTLPPRLQRPARLAFRFVDPRTPDGDPDVEARVDQQHPDEAVSPVAGWLLPDHVDEALEFFDASGRPLGQLMHDELTGAVVWEGAPGRPGPVGGPPDPGADPGARHLTRLAAAAVAADAAARNDAAGPPGESALAALLRAIDTTLWTVDPLGSVGTGAVAGLVGRPIAVVRATLRLEVQDDLELLSFADADARAARTRAYAELAGRAIAVRLGELTRADDGLLAYVVDDDYGRLCPVAPDVRSQARAGGRQQGQLGPFGPGSAAAPGVAPILHPYLSGPTEVTARPGQLVRLTLLMSPGGKVHATCGVLPRKSLALARDWFHDALVRLSPSFRVGPVLVDPTAVRLPMVTGLGERQAFTRRDTPLTWRDDPISAATQTAYLPEQPSTLQEGWIRVEPREAGGAP